MKIFYTGVISRMNKILVFASDMLPLDGLPTSGGGLRSWQIIKGLEARGFNVDARMPLERFLVRSHSQLVQDRYADILWTPQSQESIIADSNPDVIIFVNPEQNNLKRHPGIPVATDLHGPRILETVYNDHEDYQRARAIFISQKIAKLTEADFITCAGQRQRYYFLAFLLATGRAMDEIGIEYMPVSLAPETPVFHKDTQRKRIVYSGGFYPWQNAARPLLILDKTLRESGQALLDIYGGSHCVSKDDETNFHACLETLKSNPHVTFHGYQPRERILEDFASCYAAFEVMERNYERELAFTTRTVEFLWAGLPVIYNNYAELSEHIAEYKAGWCVDPCDEAAVRRAVMEAISDPDMVEEYGRNAQRLVRDRFTWDKSIEPLARFCANPRIKSRPRRYFRLYPFRSPTMNRLSAVHMELCGRNPLDFLRYMVTKAIEKMIGLFGRS